MRGVQFDGPKRFVAFRDDFNPPPPGRANPMHYAQTAFKRLFKVSR